MWHGKRSRQFFSPQDWDVYRHGVTGRVYYHNCVEGVSQWKPPRRAKGRKNLISFILLIYLDLIGVKL